MIDARGFSCPMPVVMVQKELKKSAPAELDVLVEHMRRYFGEQIGRAHV